MYLLFLMLFLHIFDVVILVLIPIIKKKYIYKKCFTFVSLYSNYGLYTAFIAKNKFFSISKLIGFISFILGYYRLHFLYSFYFWFFLLWWYRCWLICFISWFWFFCWLFFIRFRCFILLLLLWKHMFRPLCNIEFFRK